jgi:hypothetical protein
MLAVSLGVEGMECEEQEGRVNIYSALLLHCARVQGLAAMVLIPWAPNSCRMSLRTPPTYAYIPAIAFPSPSFYLKKRGEKRGEEVKNKREKLGVELP